MQDLFISRKVLQSQSMTVRSIDMHLHPSLQKLSLKTQTFHPGLDEKPWLKAQQFLQAP